MNFKIGDKVRYFKYEEQDVQVGIISRINVGMFSLVDDIDGYAISGEGSYWFIPDGHRDVQDKYVILGLANIHSWLLPDNFEDM